VQAFCARRIPFLAISEVVAATRESVTASAEYSLDAVLSADAEARAKAKENMAQYA
jgi:1-deoxy-D-xylulose 5-phosphate reductoisomerase